MADPVHKAVFTPSTLADRWGCSERHVRNMINRGELAAFRLGGKLVRIRIEAVLAVEAQPAVPPAGDPSPPPESFGAQPPTDSLSPAEPPRKRQLPAQRLDLFTRHRVARLRITNSKG